MSRTLMYVLVLPLLAAEIWAQFVAHDQQLVNVFCLLALAVLAVRWATAPRIEAEAAADEDGQEGDR